MDICFLGRLGAAILVALLGLFIAAHTHIELRADQLGLLILLGAAIYGYGQIKAYFDARDRE